MTHCLAMSLKLSAQIHKLRGVRALRQSLWRREQQSRAGMERVRAASSGESPDSTWNGPHFAEEGGKDANNSTLSSPH